MNKNRIKLTESKLQRVIKENVKRVLSEGRNDALYEWFMDLIANEAEQLYALGSLEDAKAAIEKRIKHSTLSPTKKYEYLNGGFDFNGVLGAKDMDMLGKIIAQIGMAGTGYGLQGTGHRNRFNNKFRLKESQLHKVIKESVKKVLRESIDFDNLSNIEITQQVRLEFNRALEDAHNAIEQECQELLSSDYWMNGADDGIILHQSYYDWVRDRLTDVISPLLRNILPVGTPMP